MILNVTEAILLMVFYISGERNEKVLKLIRKVHRKREQNLIEFGIVCFPRDEYDGSDKEYLRDLIRFRRAQYLMLLLVFILVFLTGVICSNLPPT